MTQLSGGDAAARILYLEDEMLIAIDTAMELAEAGYAAVTTCHALDAAEQAAAAQHFDVALLDINLTGQQNSLELGRALLAAGTRVIFATGDPSQVEDLSHLGFSLLEKPYSIPQLLALIEQAAKPEAPAGP